MDISDKMLETLKLRKSPSSINSGFNSDKVNTMQGYMKGKEGYQGEKKNIEKEYNKLVKNTGDPREAAEILAKKYNMSPEKILEYSMGFAKGHDAEYTPKEIPESKKDLDSNKDMIEYIHKRIPTLSHDEIEEMIKKMGYADGKDEMDSPHFQNISPEEKQRFREVMKEFYAKDKPTKVLRHNKHHPELEGYADGKDDEVWSTQDDEKVCKECQKNDQVSTAITGDPPKHKNCRCGTYAKGKDHRPFTVVVDASEGKPKRVIHCDDQEEADLTVHFAESKGLSASVCDGFADGKDGFVSRQLKKEPLKAEPIDKVAAHGSEKDKLVDLIDEEEFEEKRKAVVPEGVEPFRPERKEEEYVKVTRPAGKSDIPADFGSKLKDNMGDKGLKDPRSKKSIARMKTVVDHEKKAKSFPYWLIKGDKKFIVRATDEELGWLESLSKKKGYTIQKKED